MKVTFLFTCILLSSVFLVSVSADKFDNDVLSVRNGTFKGGSSETQQAYSDVLNRFVHCFPEETLESFRCLDLTVTTHPVIWVVTEARVDFDFMKLLSSNRVTCVERSVSISVSFWHWLFSEKLFVCGAAPGYV